MNIGLLPVNQLDRSKTRLAGVFDADARRQISLALLEDALELCAKATFLQWWVVSEDDEVRELARTRGIEGLRDEGTGLNEAVGMGIAHATSLGAESITVLPVDVPSTTEYDLMDLIDTGTTSDVVVVPSSRGGGTNALYLSPPDLMPPRFGQASLRAHMDAAESLKLRCAVLSLPRMSLDIDTIEDVDAFLERAKPGGRSYDVLSLLRPGANV